MTQIDNISAAIQHDVRHGACSAGAIASACDGQEPPQHTLDLAACRHSIDASPRGFSLVELIIVVLIIGITASLVVTAVGQTQTTALRAAGQILAADIGYAQVESITHSDDPRIIVFDMDSHSYHVALSSAPDDPIEDPLSGGDFRVTMGRGKAAQLGDVELLGAWLGGDDTLGFGAFGQIDQTSAALISLKAEQHMIMLRVDPAQGDIQTSHIVLEDSPLRALFKKPQQDTDWELITKLTD